MVTQMKNGLCFLNSLDFITTTSASGKKSENFLDMIKESEPLNHPVREHIRKEDLDVHDNNGLELIYAEAGKADRNSHWNNHTRNFFVTSLILICVIFFITLYFRFNDMCSRQFFTGSSILNKANIIMPELDPCDDFYSFTCGRWNRSISKRDHASVIQETEIRNLLRLECLLKHSSSKTSNPWTRFMKETLDLCEMEKYSSVEESKTVTFVKDVAAPLLQNGFNKSCTDDALRRVYHKFLQNGLFSWDVTLDLKDDEIIQALRIAPPKKQRNNDLPFKSKHHIEEYVKDILSLLGAERESLHSRCGEIADFILLLQVHTNKTASKTHQGVLSRKRVTYVEFVKEYDFIDFNEYFREFRLPESVFVVIEESDYFKWLGDFIKKAGKDSQIIQNFLYWSFVDFFVPYMPKPFGEIRDEYANKLGGKLQQRHVCLNAVKKGMNFAVSSFFMDKVLDDKSRDMVNDILLHVKNSFRDFLHTLKKPNNNSKKWLHGLEGVFNNIEIGIPSYLQKIYEDNLPFSPVEDSFPSYYMAAIRFIKTKMLSYIDLVPLAVLFLPDFLQLNGIFVSLPLMVINMGILTPPLFHPRQSLSLNYAGLGFVLSHELAHSIDYLAIDVTSVRNYIKLKLDCLQKQNAETKRVSDVIKEDFADNVGIKVAYKAYLEHISRHYSFKEITLDERKMFFIHFGQILCEDGSSFNPDRNAYHSPYKHRVNIPLSNLPEFSETFSCPKSSRMNNENKCLI